jgi:hypothetical protein
MNPAGTSPRNASSGNSSQINVVLRDAVMGRGDYIEVIDIVVSNTSQRSAIVPQRFVKSFYQMPGTFWRSLSFPPPTLSLLRQIPTSPRIAT